MQSESPFNAVPLVPLAIVAACVLIEIVFQLAGRGIIGGDTAPAWRSNAWQDFAFAPAVVTEIFERGRGSFDLWKRFLTYPFFHVSGQHLIFAAVLMLALGKFVGEKLNPFAFAILFFVSSALGALVYGLISPRNVSLVGLYPGVYGLIGAYTYMMWLALGRMGENQLKAFQLIGVLMGLLLVYSMIFGTSPTWIAEVAGFVIGLTLAPLVAPGGWRAFLARMRQR
ncbi:MAG: rhomboid family intramembrane serine protease [Pseudomonadota bacterium]